MFQALDGGGKSQAAITGQRGVAERRQELRDRSRAGSAVILSEGAIADAMETILDPPVSSRKSQEIRRLGLILRQTGYEKQCFY